MSAPRNAGRRVPIGGKPHLLFVVNTDWFFLSHRLPLALEAVRRGWRVTLVAPDTGRLHEAEGHGLEVVDLPLSRSGANPVTEAPTVVFLARLYRRLRPSLIHHVTPKPVVYGSLAAYAAPRVPVVNAVSGLGYAFIGKPWWHPLPVVAWRLYQLALGRRRSWAIFQNPDDLEALRALVGPGHSVLIRGSGVDLDRFAPAPEPGGTPLVVLPARLLRDKGVEEFVEAARVLRDRGVEARFALVGPLDAGNPASVLEGDLERWRAERVVEWWGHRTDMPEVYRQATVVALPSYREGLPKALLEAGATARAIVTTDVPGCREVVTHGETGLLVPARDAAALADAVQRLLEDAETRDRLRKASRASIEANYGIDSVVGAHFRLYERALQGGAD